MVRYFADLPAAVVLIIGWFAVVFTRRRRRGLRSSLIDWMRWTYGVGGYSSLTIDDYPPFGIRA